MSGTPLKTSMNRTHSVLRITSWLRRPRASPIPMGKLTTMPANASNRFSINPPQCSVDTGCSQGTPGSPRSSTRVNRKAQTARMDTHPQVPRRVNLPRVHPSSKDGTLANRSRRISHPMRSRLKGRNANRATTTVTMMAIRLVSPLPTMAQDIPSSRVTSISASCGRQKQFCPGQACSVLYWPMMSSPPRVLITVKSASTANQRRPYHSAQPAIAPTTAVSAVLNQELNRLARSHPTRPVSERGGGS